MADADQPVLKKAEGTPISWASGKDPTKKVSGCRLHRAQTHWPVTEEVRLARCCVAHPHKQFRLQSVLRLFESGIVCCVASLKLTIMCVAHS